MLQTAGMQLKATWRNDASLSSRRYQRIPRESPHHRFLYRCLRRSSSMR